MAHLLVFPVFIVEYYTIPAAAIDRAGHRLYNVGIVFKTIPTKEN